MLHGAKSIGRGSASVARVAERGEASEFTRAINDDLLTRLPFEDRQDFEDAARGLIATLDPAPVLGANGRVVWDPSAFAFIEQGSDAPDTVNPSLWRQSQLVSQGGLFEVVPRIYQVRNADLSNLTIVEGDSGLIVFDPLISAECAAAAMELYFAHRPRKPVVAVLYSHSHVDHYGGVKGVVSQADVDAGRVRVIAPEGFLEAAVAENVFAGTAMSRRATYMYGVLLPRDAKGNVGSGLGMATSAGTVTLIVPTETITQTGQKLDIDGLTFEFLLAPDTEAPSEMHWFIEELGALTAAENCCHTLHNTYTLRGAQIRDPHAWSRYLNDTIERWGEKTEVLYGMHHWPVWGRDRALDLLRKGRDGYAFINDETLRLANHGYGPVEISEMVTLPDDPRPPLGAARLLRHDQSQRQGDVRQIPRLVRRQPRPPAPAAARGERRALRRADGRRRRRARAGAGGVRPRRVPLGLPDRQPRRVRRPLEHRGARAPGGGVRAARLPGRVGAVAQHLPVGRARAAPRNAQRSGAQRGLARHGASDDARPVLQLTSPCGSTARRPAT